jgi:hypothetical protein
MRSPNQHPLTHRSAPQLFRLLRAGLAALKAAPQPATVHHSNANRSLQWDAQKEVSLAVPYRKQVFHVQLALERHAEKGMRRVIIFGRRLKPPSTAPSPNTQRGTFNSMNAGDHGFYLRPQVLKKNAAMRRALGASLPGAGPGPFWRNGRIHLGDGSPKTVLLNFLKAVAVVEEIKGIPPGELESRFPDEPVFTPEDIAAVETFAEGRAQTVSRAVRERSARLHELAVEHYRKLSPDGRLRCAVDGWVPAVPVHGAIVEIHHDDALHEYPDNGRDLPLERALKLLAPLCPNCHRMLHSKPGGGRYTVAKLKQLVRKPQPVKA